MGKFPNEHQSSALNPAVLSQKLESFSNSPSRRSLKSTLAEARHLDSNLNSIHASKGNFSQSRERSNDNIFRITAHDEEKKSSFLREKLTAAKFQEDEMGLKPLHHIQPKSRKRSQLEAVLRSQNLPDTLAQSHDGEINSIEKSPQSHKKDLDEESRRSSRLKDECGEKLKSSTSLDRNCSFVLRNEKQLGKSSRDNSGLINSSVDSLKVMKFGDSPQQESKAQLDLKEQQNPRHQNLFGLNNNKLAQPQLIDENRSVRGSSVRGNSVRGSSVGEGSQVGGRGRLEATNNLSEKSGVGELAKKESEKFGKIIRWKMGGVIGSGSFGQVCKAMEIDTGKIIAVKKIPYVNTLANETVLSVDAELMLLRKLTHPNIVQFLGSESLENALYIYMEYVAGGSIPSIYSQYGPLHEKTIKVYAKQILSGLEYLHKNGVIHKDIKGANILIHKDGTVKLADFGCSSQLERTLSIAGNPIKNGLKGSIPWMAPEVVKETGHGRRSDIWSFGCTILEMATGQTPWSQHGFENPITMMMKIALSDELPIIPETLSEGLKDFILCCLNRKQEERPQAAELLSHKFLAD